MLNKLNVWQKAPLDSIFYLPTLCSLVDTKTVGRIACVKKSWAAHSLDENLWQTCLLRDYLTPAKENPYGEQMGTSREAYMAWYQGFGHKYGHALPRAARAINALKVSSAGSGRCVLLNSLPFIFFGSCMIGMLSLITSILTAGGGGGG